MTRKCWELGTIGLHNPADEPESIKFMNDLGNNLKTVNGRYRVAWPWKLSRFELPDNYKMVRARLESLVRNRKRDMNLMKKSNGKGSN